MRHGHPDSSELLFTRVVDGQAVERRWDGIDQSLSSEIDGEFRVFLRAFERARAAALSAVPSEAWPLAAVAPDGTFRGIAR
ncbi:MAG: hypothetical protein HZA52_01585 [Planctomycetes bacterium]|nr:hypothetical protein [Planctomycetota bacterium]